MMNLRQRTVNVNRLELLKALEENREKHRAEYKEALVEFHRRLLEDLEQAHRTVAETKNIEDLQKFRMSILFPQNHEKDYDEVIDMLKWSADETINLDAESFKAYVKNEWSWTSSFLHTKALYAVAGSSFSG